MLYLKGIKNNKMKKIYLLLFCAISFTATQAQNTVTPQTRVGNGTVKQVQDVTPTSAKPATYSKKTRKTTEAFPLSGIGTKEIVGKTSYDLQTNGAIQRRIMQVGTNGLSCGWTMSHEQLATGTSAFADRGTGYATFNGTTWSPQPATRLESVRTGFGGILVDGTGKEIYICHDGTNIVKTTKTGTTWSNANLGLNSAFTAIWPHAASSENWLYVVASSSDSLIKSNGIRNGMFFSRSSDNGATWIDNMIPLPLVDSVNQFRAGGNSYSIAARGNKVVIVCGDMGADLTMITSNDHGATWTKTVLVDWPLDNYDFAGTVSTDTNGDAVADSLWTTDGSHSVALATNGEIHVTFPYINVVKAGGATSFNFRFDSRLGYQKIDPTGSIVIDTVIDQIFDIQKDCDGDGTFSIGDNYTGATATTPDAIYSTIGTMTMPSISLVESGTATKVLIAYTAIMDADTTVDNLSQPYWFGASSLTGQNYRDIMVMGSSDNGATWTENAVNITKTAHYEEVFPSTPEIITGNNLYVIYQGDIEPGTILQNNDIADDLFSNNMIVQTVSIADIFTLGADTNAPCGQVDLPLTIKDNITVAEGKVSVYPVPVSDIVTVALQLVATSKNVKYELTDMIGNIVYSNTTTNVTSEKVKINMSQMAAGTYLLKVKTDSGTMVRKIAKN